MVKEILEMLKANPELLTELLQDPELRETIKNTLKQPREKSLKAKLKRWGIENIPEEYLEVFPMIESFLEWLDREIQKITNGEKGLHLTLRPLKHTKKNQEQEDQEE